MTPPQTTNPVVVKLGGALLDAPGGLEALWQGVHQVHAAAPVVIVHGGGKQATDAARRLGHEPRIIHGRRVTTDLDLEIVQWTMRGGVNVQLVAQAARAGLSAVGLSGADGGLLRVHKRPPWRLDGETVDFGWVGDVEHVDTKVLDRLLAGGFVPVVAPLGIDAGGHLYNVNADTVALSIAAALHASKLLLVTEAGGVKRDLEDPGAHLARCDRATYEEGLAAGWISGGMRVKLHVAFEALRAGIGEVCILAPDDLVARTSATQVVL